ncbi:hypothetical protein Tco_0690399 [Tanacetum coccineum]
MRTRSQTRNRNRQQQAQPAVVQPFHLEEPFVNPPLVPMADNRTMAQLLQAPTEGYEDAIVIPEINANFELKHGLINLVQNKQFFGHDKEDPHAHIHEPFSGSTTNHSDALPPSSSLVKTSHNLEDFADELTLLKKGGHEENFQVYSNPLFEFDDNFTSSNKNYMMRSNAISSHGSFFSNFEEGLILRISYPLPIEDSDPVQEEIDIFLVPDDLIPPGVENDDSEDEDIELPNNDHQDNPVIFLVLSDNPTFLKTLVFVVLSCPLELLAIVCN